MSAPLTYVEGDLAARAAAVDAFHRDLSLGPIDAGALTTLDRAIPSLRDPMNTLAASLNEIAQRDILRAIQHSGRSAARTKARVNGKGNRYQRGGTNP
ncbi:hypothetical protein ABMC88_04420 [Sulfitobacter sp. HNIBRBA2951]|uniref:hypothetical protein n=1 Tax=Sulfitobacter aquimarinus TaxID=3158557 RepID=UPI0032DFF10B